jgi:segregation and condensation protein B
MKHETRQLPLMLQIEALLFTAAKYVAIEDLAAYSKSSVEEIKTAIDDLKKRYAEINNSLTILDQETSVKLNVKDDYIHLAHKVVSTIEFEKPLMETLAVIAWKYPALQSDIIRIRHNKAYDHLSRLEEYGFIKRSRYGRTRKISLTQKFFEYFDLPSREQAQQAFRDSLPKEVKENIQITEKQIEDSEKKIEEARVEDEKLKEEKQKEEEDADIIAKKLKVYEADESSQSKKEEVEVVDDTGRQIDMETYVEENKKEDIGHKESLGKDDEEKNDVVKKNESVKGMDISSNVGGSFPKAEKNDKKDIFAETDLMEDKGSGSKVGESSDYSKAIDEAQHTGTKVSAEVVDKKAEALIAGKEFKYDEQNKNVEQKNTSDSENEFRSQDIEKDEDEITEDDEVVKQVEKEYSDMNEDTGEEDLTNLPEEQKEVDDEDMDKKEE